jgi:hypothetical protein
MRSTTAAAETKSRRRRISTANARFIKEVRKGVLTSSRHARYTYPARPRGGLASNSVTSACRSMSRPSFHVTPAREVPRAGMSLQISEAEGLLEQGEQRFVVSAELDHEPRRASWARSEMSLRGRESREEPAKIFRRYVYSARDGLGAAVESA